MHLSIVWKFAGYGTFGRILPGWRLLSVVHTRSQGELARLCHFWTWRTSGIRLTSTRVELAQGYLLIGKLEEAALIASHALDIFQHHAEPAREAGALYVLGEIARVGTPTDFAKAQETYQRAVALAEELRMRPLRRSLPRGLGKLYRAHR